MMLFSTQFRIRNPIPGEVRVLILKLRFYEELNDFLPAEKRKVRFPRRIPRAASVKDVIESQGVPHAEVDLILVNGRPVDFSYRVRDGDDISVYPVFESLDITPVTRLQARPLRRTRFVLDAHLGKLARHLRLLGFDAHYRKHLKDEELIRIMQDGGRTLLTRDRELLKRKTVTHGYYLRSKIPPEQIVEVLRRFDLAEQTRPFTRCLECNAALEKADKKRILDRLPPLTKKRFEDFEHCPGCGRVYWRGSHFDRMKNFVETILREARRANRPLRPGTGT